MRTSEGTADVWCKVLSNKARAASATWRRKKRERRLNPGPRVVYFCKKFWRHGSWGISHGTWSYFYSLHGTGVWTSHFICTTSTALSPRTLNTMWRQAVISRLIISIKGRNIPAPIRVRFDIKPKLYQCVSDHQLLLRLLSQLDFKHLSGHLSSNSQDPLNKMQNIHFDAAKDIEEGSSAEDKLVQSGTGNEAKHRMSSKMFILRYQILPLVLLLVVDLAIPLAIYYIFRIFTTEIIALIVSGIPPLLRVVYILIRYRRIDILSCIFVVSFVVSGVLSIVNGKQRLCNRATFDNVLNIWLLFHRWCTRCSASGLVHHCHHRCSISVHVNTHSILLVTHLSIDSSRRTRVPSGCATKTLARQRRQSIRGTTLHLDLEERSRIPDTFLLAYHCLGSHPFRRICSASCIDINWLPYWPHCLHWNLRHDCYLCHYGHHNHIFELTDTKKQYRRLAKVQSWQRPDWDRRARRAYTLSNACKPFI